MRDRLGLSIGDDRPIVDAARDAGASNEVLSMLDGLPEQDYADVNAVTQWVAGNFGPGLGI